MTSRPGSHRSGRVRVHPCVRNYKGMANWIRLSSSGWYLFVDDVLADADTVTLLSADSCWQFSVQDWQRREPSRRRRAARRAWRAEETALAEEQARLLAASASLRTLRPFADCE